MKTEIWALGLVLAASLIGSFGPILLKKATHTLKLNLKNIFSNKYLFFGLSCYGLSTILFIPALKGGDLSVLYPFVALVYVWVSFLSIKFLNEKMTKLKWIGIALILLGVTLIGLSS